MTVQELIERAESNGLTILVEGNWIKVKAPQEPKGEARALFEELRHHKEEILKALTQKTSPEALATSILAEHTPDEATQILDFWKQTLGVDVDPARARDPRVKGGVREHLERLREWQGRFRG